MASETGVIGLMLFAGILITAMKKGPWNRAQGSWGKAGRREQGAGKKTRLSSSVLCPEPCTQGTSIEFGTLAPLLHSPCSLFPTFPPSLFHLLFAQCSILILALISVPFYTLPVHILFFMFMSIISSEITPWIFIHHNARGKIIKAMGFLVLTGFALFLIKSTYKQCKDYYSLDEAVMLYQVGNYKEACDSFSELTESFCYDGVFWQYYAKSRNMNKEYFESIKLYEKAKKYTSDEYLYTSLGDSYKEILDYLRAEEAFLHAAFLAPHKLYPLYLLAKLYDTAGEKEKAIKTAKSILNKKAKVESEAVEEIFQEMRKIQEKNVGSNKIHY
jgi:hypothetical protein